MKDTSQIHNKEENAWNSDPSSAVTATVTGVSRTCKVWQLLQIHKSFISIHVQYFSPHNSHRMCIHCYSKDISTYMCYICWGRIKIEQSRIGVSRTGILYYYYDSAEQHQHRDADQVLSPYARSWSILYRSSRYSKLHQRSFANLKSSRRLGLGLGCHCQWQPEWSSDSDFKFKLDTPPSRLRVRAH